MSLKGRLTYAGPMGPTGPMGVAGAVGPTGAKGDGADFIFTDGLTETNGTVSWDLSSNIGKENNTVIVGKLSTQGTKQFGDSNNFIISDVKDSTIKQNIDFTDVNANKGGNLIITKSLSDSDLKMSGVSSIVCGTLEDSRKQLSNITHSATAGITVAHIMTAGTVINQGRGSMAIGDCIGGSINTSGYGSCAIGVANGLTGTGTNNLIASGQASFAQGIGNQAVGEASVAHGFATIAEGNYAATFGNHTRTIGDCQLAIGEYNDAYSPDLVFMIGNGSTYGNSNALIADYAGNLTLAGIVSPSGADYAEYFEWADGNTENEERIGYLVALVGDKIKKANSTDEILGIISGFQSVVGDSAEMNWCDKYLKDEFDRIIYENIVVHHNAVIDEETNNIITPDWDENIHIPKLNPDYNSELEYVPRSKRKEWGAVGLLGKIKARYTGELSVGDYITAQDGIAIKSETKTNLRVLEINNDHIARILIK